MINNNKWLIIKLSLESEPKDIIVPKFGCPYPKTFLESGEELIKILKIYLHTETNNKTWIDFVIFFINYFND